MTTTSPRHIDHSLKIVMFGDACVGKSAILDRFSTDQFSDVWSGHSASAAYKSRIIDIDDKHVKIQLWDTPGYRHYRALHTLYYKEACAFAFVFDICNRDSFENIVTWLEDAERCGDPSAKLLLIGNKCDKASERTVPEADAQAFAAEHGMSYVETSAKNGTNVHSAITQLAQSVLTDMRSKQ